MGMAAAGKVRNEIAPNIHPKGRVGQTDPLGRPTDTKRGLYSKVYIIYLIRRWLCPASFHLKRTADAKAFDAIGFSLT